MAAPPACCTLAVLPTTQATPSYLLVVPRPPVVVVSVIAAAPAATTSPVVVQISLVLVVLNVGCCEGLGPLLRHARALYTRLAPPVFGLCGQDSTHGTQVISHCPERFDVLAE